MFKYSVVLSLLASISLIASDIKTHGGQKLSQAEIDKYQITIYPNGQNLPSGICIQLIKKNLNDLKAKSLFNLATNPQEEDKKNLINNPVYSQIKKQLLKKFIEVRKLGQSLLND